MSHQRLVRFLLPALVNANVVIKLLWLGRTELAHDEPFTVYWSQRTLAELWDMMQTENNPPLFFLLIKAWSAFVPFDAAWLRVPSALFSALAVWPLFLLAQRLGGIRVALVAALLFTLNNYHYGFAHEVRTYALFTLLSVLSMWLLVRAIDKPRNGSRALLGLAAVNVLLTYTHFFGWLLIAVQVLCVLLIVDLRPLRRSFFLGLLLTVALYLPYATTFISRVSQSVSQGTWLEAPVPEELYNMVWRWSNAPVMAVLFLLLFVVAVMRSRGRGAAIQLALLWTFVPLFGMFLASYVAPMFHDRYLVYAAPGFALLVALSINALDLGSKATSGIAVLAVLGLGFTFAPWADAGRHPSRVVAQANEWCNGECSLEVLPRWYWLTYTATQDVNNLRHENQLVFGEAIPEKRYPLGAQLDTLRNAIVIDAGADLVDADRTWYKNLRTIYPIVDSVEADHRVWVYRFRR